MKKIFVSDLSVTSQKLFESKAKENSFNPEDIQNGLNSKIRDLDDTLKVLGLELSTDNELQKI